MYQLPPQQVEFYRPDGFFFQKAYQGEEKRLLLDTFNYAVHEYLSQSYSFFGSDSWEDSLNALKEIYKMDKKGLINALKKAFGKLIKALGVVIDKVGEKFQFKFLNKTYHLTREGALDLLKHLKEGNIFAKIDNMVIAWGHPLQERKTLKR
ncbi:MAG: hypothetical protein GXN92_03545 [Candidatus Micrarchaeota archaeon]|nr:hypothetical protein [Candidatus Micrarchaeota archaeon]